VSAVIPLGRIESVDLRSAWPDEAKNFTPWLADEDNLGLLGSALGLELELEAVEKQVGPFSADILAKVVGSEQWVLIENQIEITDHSHLGQILTYAAGLDASIVVWIARAFREQHRAAIDFLNRITNEDRSFFGIQVELLRIGESAYAPGFTVVAKPNDWAKQTAAAKAASDDSLTPGQLIYREYWGSLIDQAKGSYPALANREPYKGSYQAVERVGSGRGFCLDVNAAFSKGAGLRVELYISGRDAAAAFEYLLEQRQQVEAVFGNELHWDPCRGQEARISFSMPGNPSREDKKRWAEQRDWLLTNLKLLADAFRPVLNPLKSQLRSNQD
jgi:Domain of unknown function (DUF4268)